MTSFPPDHSFLPPDLFCPVHRNQGPRIVCRFCSYSLLPPRASGVSRRNTGESFFSADPQKVSGQVIADGSKHG